MSHSSDLIHLITTRALNLDEQLLAAGGSVEPAILSDDTSAALDPWIRAFSPGRPEALLERLAWDGISLRQAATALGTSQPDSTDPLLAADIASFVEASLLRSKNEPDAGSTSEIPFLPLWQPFIDLANRTLSAAPCPAMDLFEEQALEDLLHNLSIHLSWWGTPTAWHRFDSLRAERSISFDGFCHDILAGPLEFYGEHAALLRRLLLLKNQWVAGTAELVNRLAADREAIESGLGIEVVRVSHVRTGLSDRHHGGRQVAVLELESGKRLVYKPRESHSLFRFNELLSWYGGHGGDEAPPAIRVVDRTTHAWVEFADHDTLDARDSVARYYRKAGSLLCLAWILGGRDLHMDNVICTADGPVIIDTEVFVQPRWAESEGGEGAIQLARDKVHSSVIGTGMLSFPQEDASGRVYDIGGLCGTGGYQSVPHRVWLDVNTDLMRASEEERVTPSMENVVRHDGVIESPEDWVDEIASGFTTTFETILTHRDELLRDDGPLASFRNARARILFRPSNQYATLLQLLTGPTCSRSGLTTSLYIESLARVFSNEKKKPELWPLVRDERRSLEALDIPLFTVSCSTLTIETLDGEKLEGLIDESGVDALITRVRALDRETLREQTRLIRASLATASAHSVDERDGESPITGDPPADPRVFVDEACRIGESILAAAIRGSDGGVTWLAPEYVKITSLADLGATYYLYSGVTGPSVFLAALGRITGDDRFSQPARGAWSTLEHLIESGDAKPVRGHLRLGICNGMGSIIFAAVLASELLNDSSLLRVARGFAELIDEDRFATETDFDIEGGVAGAVLALVRLYEATNEDAWLSLARHGARRLAERSRSDPSGTFWPHDENAPPLAGMAHGAAGAALALAGFARASGEQEYATLAADAFRWERTVYDPSLGNWPVRTSDGRKIDMVAWCHGAAGIGLTRLAIRSVVGSVVDEDLDLAIQSVLMTGLHPVDHVCCGNAGRIDFLVEASIAGKRADLLAEARRRAAATLDRAKHAGGYAFTEGSGENDLMRPGFFRGLAGIGYTLLRVAVTDELPSISRFAGHKENHA